MAALLMGTAGLKLCVIDFPLPNGLDDGVYATAKNTSFGRKQTVQVSPMSTSSFWEIKHLDVTTKDGVAAITASSTLPLHIRECDRSADIRIDVSQKQYPHY